MQFCLHCTINGFCRRLKNPIVPDHILRDPLYLADLKAFLVEYTFKHKITPQHWPDHLVGLYRDYRGWLHDEAGDEVFLDMEELEFEFIREWFRDFIELVPHGVSPRVRSVARERVRIIATLMSIYHPAKAMLWGVRPANDN